MAIAVLDSVLVDKIAAGEVVERPASVVKELVENSLDAGATVLEVHLRRGGADQIRIVDDGEGMDRADALLCFRRHATSKIRTEADLLAVGTLGFRGEAMPSIASVSRLRLTTSRSDTEPGTVVEVAAGIRQAVHDGPPMKGTEIVVDELFFNIPVRRKFMRTPSTELKHCLEAVARAVVARPDVDVSVTHDGRSVLRLRRVDSLAERVASMLSEPRGSLLPVDYRAGGVHVTGVVAPLERHRGGATGAQYLHVNGRFVRDLVLRRALAEAGSGQIPKGRHLVTVLDVQLDPHMVDVNAHPAKIEVRFREPGRVASTVALALQRALSGRRAEPVTPVRGAQGALWAPSRPAERLPLPLVPAHPGDDPRTAGELARTKVQPSLGAPSPSLRKAAAAPMRSMPARDLVAADTPRPKSPLLPPRGAPLPAPVVGDRPLPQSAPALSSLRVVGQLGLRWLVLDDGECSWWLSLVEGRARLILAALEDPSSPACCSPPVLLSLERAEERALSARAEDYERIGFLVNPVRPGEWAVGERPAVCPEDAASQVIRALLGAASEDFLRRAARAIAEATLEPMSRGEVRGLLGALDSVGANGLAVRRTAGELDRWLA